MNGALRLYREVAPHVRRRAEVEMVDQARGRLELGVGILGGDAARNHYIEKRESKPAWKANNAMSQNMRPRYKPTKQTPQEDGRDTSGALDNTRQHGTGLHPERYIASTTGPFEIRLTWQTQEQSGFSSILRYIL